MGANGRIISLCDYTGIWSAPYRENGYEVIQVDLERGQDVRLQEFLGNNGSGVCGVIAQPPCTHLAGSGAGWWKKKGEGPLLEGLAIVDACMRIILSVRPRWWVLENPVGRLSRFIGPPQYTFQPSEFALFADDPGEEAYTKRTCLWGTFTLPTPLFTGKDAALPPVLGSKMQKYGPTKNRARLRSKTPEGFARAFYQANR